jgi:hypothetical protein
LQELPAPLVRKALQVPLEPLAYKVSQALLVSQVQPAYRALQEPLVPRVYRVPLAPQAYKVPRVLALLVLQVPLVPQDHKVFLLAFLSIPQRQQLQAEIQAQVL